MSRFPGGLDNKASAHNAQDPDSIHGLGRSPGEGNGNPLQYSCLENPMDEGAWCSTVHGVTKSRTRLSHFTSLHYRVLECKSRKSRNTWSNRQIWPWTTEWSRAEANRVLPREDTLFQQHKKRLYTWTSPDGQYQNQIIFFAAEDGEALYSQQKQNQELTVAQIMNSLLPNSDLNWRKWGKPLGHSGMT